MDNIYQECIAALEKKDLSCALHHLDILIDAAHDWNLQNEKNVILDNYKRLLQYYKNGTEDDRRQDLYYSFIAKCWFLTNKTFRMIKEHDSSEEFFIQTRSCKQRKLTSDGIINEMNNLSQEWVFSSLTDTPTTQQRKQRKREQLIIDLFHIIWTSDNWTINEIKAAQSFLNSTEQNNDVKLSFISAVFMGTYFFFDPLKTELLIKYATHKDPHIRTRALTGLLFVLRRYSRLLFCIPETTQHFLQLTREKGFQKELIHFQLSVLSQNTKDIEKKINNDILPAIKKSNQTVIDLEQINDLLNEDDIPDSIINDEIKELHNKLNDLMELHNNGADMSYFSFSHLKKFPFFQSPANWFLPFSIDHSQLDSNIISNNSFVKFLLENNEMCDSDKYSFCLMLSHLPQAQWDNMQDRFKQQFGESMPDQDISTDINIQRHYVQDCYRFFMLYHNRTGINNPFESDPLLLNNPLFAPLFMDKDVLLRIANFCYKRKFGNRLQIPTIF